MFISFLTIYTHIYAPTIQCPSVKIKNKIHSYVKQGTLSKIDVKEQKKNCFHNNSVLPITKKQQQFSISFFFYSLLILP